MLVEPTISLFPKQQHIIPKTATLFIHHAADFKKEIMPKGKGSTSNDFTVEMLLFKHFVYVRAVAMHLRGEPFDRPALLVENRFDDMSYMNLRHRPCLKLFQELLSEVEVLEYHLSQQESPQYTLAGDPLSW